MNTLNIQCSYAKELQGKQSCNGRDEHKNDVVDGDKEFHYLPLEAKRRDRLENEGEKYSEIGGKDNCFNVQMSKTERNLEKTEMVFKKKIPKTY